jgi:hypothetical protein
VLRKKNDEEEEEKGILKKMRRLATGRVSQMTVLFQKNPGIEKDKFVGRK